MKLPFALAKRFVAGETLDQAIPEVEKINTKGIQVTLDLLGEDVEDRRTAQDTVDTYIKLLRGINEAGLDSTISIKLTMIGLDIDHAYCKENLFRLLDVAREEDQFVRIDMEGSTHTQATIDLFRSAHKEYGKHVGIVLQAYLYRTEKDVRDLADLGADIRLCKGAYSEPKDIAIQEMPEIREAYKEYAKILLEKTEYPRIATHDDELIEWTKAYTAREGIGKDRFEFQMLYGLRQDTMEAFVEQGYNARIYVPYGTMWFPYFKRRLMERKENIWFVLSTMFKK